MLAAIASGVLTKLLGRKTILVLGEGICFIFILTIALMQMVQGLFDFDPSDGFNIAQAIFIYIFMFSFGISLGPIVWIYNAEILPEKGVALATVVNWISAFVSGLTIPPLYSALPPEFRFTIFIFFSLCSFGGLIYVLKFVKETKGRDQNEINQMFDQYYQYSRSHKTFQDDSFLQQKLFDERDNINDSYYLSLGPEEIKQQPTF